MLRPFTDRVLLVDAGRAGLNAPTLVLHEVLGGTASPDAALKRDQLAGRAVVYTWDVEAARAAISGWSRVAGFLSKALDASDLVDALERIDAGELVVAGARRQEEPTPERVPAGSDPTVAWPGRHLGLSRREAQVLTLIATGISNKDIAESTHLSMNTIKSYIRATYQRIGATSRSQAVIWALTNGLISAEEIPHAPSFSGRSRRLRTAVGHGG